MLEMRIISLFNYSNIAYIDISATNLYGSIFFL